MYPGNVMCEYSVYIYICIHTLHRKPHPRPLSQRCQGIKKDHTCKYKMKNRICEYNVWSSLICRYKILIAICSNKMLIYNILISIYKFMYTYICKGTERSPSLDDVESSEWNQLALQQEALFFVASTHRLCTQHCVSALKQSRGAIFRTPRVKSWRNLPRVSITVTKPGFLCKAAC